MPDLIAKSALGGATLTRAGCTLREADPGQITSVAPFPGQGGALDATLAALGLRFPPPNGQSTSGATRLIWTGLNQAFLIGAPAPDGLAAHAALTDQTDGWCGLQLSGATADAALMRLIPLDLRLSAFPVGRAVRAPLNHMNLILTRPAADSFELFVFRSMARTAWHEIEAALTRIEARLHLA